MARSAAQPAVSERLNAPPRQGNARDRHCGHEEDDLRHGPEHDAIERLVASALAAEQHLVDAEGQCEPDRAADEADGQVERGVGAAVGDAQHVLVP